MAEGSGLLTRRTWQHVPWVRIPPVPPVYPPVAQWIEQQPSKLWVGVSTTPGRAKIIIYYKYPLVNKLLGDI